MKYLRKWVKKLPVSFDSWKITEDTLLDEEGRGLKKGRYWGKEAVGRDVVREVGEEGEAGY